MQYTLAALDAWEKIVGVPKKLIMTRPIYFERPFYEMHDEICRWYDYHFKGVDNGIMDEPPVKLWLTGREDWIFETNGRWPEPSGKKYTCEATISSRTDRSSWKTCLPADSASRRWSLRTKYIP